MTYDYATVYQFLLHTPESGLRKLLVDQKPMTDLHFNLLIKIVRSCSEAQFINHIQVQDFPKIKFSSSELKLKEKFWNDVIVTLSARGLLTEAVKTAA
jgi:hypothetical protein